MAESIQHKLSRVRPPRVQITYDVEIGDAIQKKELPFVIGVMADLSAVPRETLPDLPDRRFVEIDRDNFDEVMSDAAPGVDLSVANKIATDDEGNPVEEPLSVKLAFQSFEDFDPRAIIQQEPNMAELFAAREALRDLAVKLDGNKALEAELLKVIKDGKKDALLDLIKAEQPAETDGSAQEE